jgi:hypothetical protein
MPFVKYKIKKNTPGLDKANAILSQEYLKAAEKIGIEGVRQIRLLQRIDTGKERARTSYRIKNLITQVNIEFYNTIIQAAVDETGTVPHFPPYKAGSDLFRWVLRKGFKPTPKQSRGTATRIGRAQAKAAGLDKGSVKVAGRVAANRAADRAVKEIESISFLIARAISRRGLPRPGDPIRKPFGTFLRKAPNFSYLTFNAATGKGVSRINSEGGGRL